MLDRVVRVLSGRILAAVVLLTLPSIAMAQEGDVKPCAFGYCRGQIINEEPEGEEDGFLFIRAEHRAFDHLAVYFTHNQGVCGVAGYSYLNGDEYGLAHKREFSKFVDLVRRKNGSPTVENDFLRPGSIWDEPQYWLMALRRQEYVLDTAWVAKEGSELPRGMKLIGVQATPDSIIVRYYFDNMEKCQTEAQADIGADF